MKLTTEQRHRLLQAAREAAKHAYAPFSNFHVGAAVLTPSGEVIAGCNVENSSYGLANCAERTAIFGAVAKGFLGEGKSIQAIAVTCLDAVTAPLKDRSPCGACRQVIKEFSTDETIILVDNGKDGDVFSIEELLPHGFSFNRER